MDQRKELLEQMEKERPSTEPSYWAKSGCSTCNGTGKLGHIRTVLPGGGNNVIEQDESICFCVRKRMKRWEEEWMAAHLPAPKKPTNGNSKPQPPLTRTLERVDRYDDLLSEMKGEAHRLATLLAELPQRAQLEEIDKKISVNRESYKNINEQAEALEAQAQKLEDQATLLRKQASELEHGVSRLRSKVIPDCNQELKTLEADRERLRREFHAQSHAWARKYRILEDKIKKLERRRTRVAQEGGVPLEVSEAPQIAMDQ